MSCLTAVIIYSVILGLTLGEPKCGVNEIIDDCPANCPYETCPKDELHDKAPCPKPKECPPPACKCGFNYRRQNGTCVQTTECSPFHCSGPNEVFDPCPSICPGPDCSSATPLGLCPFYFLFVVECSPSCRCIKHHWRKNGVCVPYSQCLK